MTKLVTIYGGSGLLGRYIARRMAQAGWRVRVAVRRPNEAIFVRPYGSVGQVEPVLCNLRNEASVRAAMEGADAVVNCVGVFASAGANSLQAVNVEGAARVAAVARDLGIERLVHVSALGASAQSGSAYLQSKAEGEAAVLSAFPQAVVLRPAVVFASDDKFFNHLGRLAAKCVIVPVLAGDTKVQPVYADDVAQAAVAGVLGHAAAGIYELAGPEVMTLAQAQARAAAVAERRVVLLSLPGPFGAMAAGAMDLVQSLSLGIVKNGLLSRDQLRAFGADQVASEAYPGFEALAIAPTSVDTVLPEYLWTYRKAGQYAAIQASAKVLRG